MDLLTWFYPGEWTINGVIGFVFASVVRMFLIFQWGYRYAEWTKKQGRVLRAINKPFLYALFGFGFVYDVFLNYTVAVGIWLELPKQRFETITWRLDRYTEYRYAPDGSFWTPLTVWRFRSAEFICRLLNKVDPGHCGSDNNPTAALAALKGAK